MNHFAKSFSLTACALAVTLMVSACGGGASTDTVPPTVAITAAATGNDVVFSFTFSEALAAGTFTAGDIVVTGGTAGAFVMVDDMHATLAVTPTTGVLGVTVAANKFDDLAHNFNAVAASLNFEAAINFSNANVGLRGFNGATATLEADPTDSTNKALKIVKTTSNNAGVVVYTDTAASEKVAQVLFETSKIVTLRVYSPAANTPVMMKVAQSGDPTRYVQKTATTTGANAWETLTFDFTTPNDAPYNVAFTYNQIYIFPGFGQANAGTYYFDDLKYAGSTANAAYAAQPATPPVTTPTTTVLADFEAPTFFGFDGAGSSSIAGVPAGVPADTGPHVNVARILRSGGQVWAGAKQTVGTIPMSASSNTVSMRVYAPVAGTFHIKLEGAPGVASGEYNSNETVVVGWQTLTFTVAPSDFALAVNAVTMLPNLGVLGPVGGETFVVDDIKIGGTSGTPTTLATFEAPDFFGFDGAEGSSIAGLPAGVPADTGPHIQVARILRSGGQVWAGAKQRVGTIPMSASSNTVSMRVYAPVAGTFHIKLEGAPGVASGEYNSNETVVVGWQTLTFTVAPSDFALAVNAVTMLPNLGVLGPVGGETFVVDDIKIGPAVAAAPVVAAAGVLTTGYNPLVQQVGFFEGTTVEGGKWGYYSGNFTDVTSANTFTGGTYAPATPGGVFISVLKTTNAAAGYLGIYNVPVNGSLTLTGGQTKLMLDVSADVDWIKATNHSIRINIDGSEKFNFTDGNGGAAVCTFGVTGTITPTSGNLTSYTIPLVAAQTCTGLGGAPLVVTAADILARPIGNVSLTIDGANINTTVKNTANTGYPTGFGVGAIKFVN